MIHAQWGMAIDSSNDSQSNVAEYSVSEISGSIKKTVEGAFSHVRVRGEISGFRGPHSSGHAYFSIKDERARMDAVVWKGVYNRLKFKPEEGMEMIATGKITTYPGSSKYQIVIEQLEPAGAGALMALLEERKKKLTAEGLFDAGRKQLLPYMPKVIGVVTSPTGAVIRDILHRISDRFPVEVIVWPVRVQGETSGDEVAAAINGFNAEMSDPVIKKPDIIIVARGGGSLEDLWGFNDEAVVRAASNSDIPIISAVGHETDWTLLDLVADERAPTPTGAAEIAVPVKADLEAGLANMAARLKSASSRLIDQRRQHFVALSRGLPSLDNLLALPRRRLDDADKNLGKALELNVINKRRAFDNPANRLTPVSLTAAIADRNARLKTQSQSLNISFERVIDRKSNQLSNASRALSPMPQNIAQKTKQFSQQIRQLEMRANNAISGELEFAKQHLNAHTRMLHSLSYKSVLNRGYAILRDEQQKPVVSSKDIAKGQALQVELADGSVDVIEAGDQPDIEIKSAKPKKKPVQKTKSTEQGSLF